MPSLHAHRLHAGIAVVIALAAQLLVHGAVPESPFAPYALGSFVIRHTPGDIATATIETLGKDARPVLAGAVVLALAISGAAVGAKPLRLAVFLAIVGAAALAAEPAREPWTSASLLSVAVLVAVGWATVEMPRSEFRANGARRRFLGFAAGSGVIAVLFLANLQRGTGRKVYVPPGAPFALAPDANFPPVIGLSAVITAPADHYVVDINFEPPLLRAEEWRLRIDGGAEASASITLEEIFSPSAMQLPVFLHCISNPVGGQLMGNGLWTVIPLRDVLSDDQLSAGFQSVVAHGADGYTVAIPASNLKEVLLATAISGAAIPRRHGFPVRLLWPGRYGMLSLKWLTRLELSNKIADGFWAERGWDRDGFLKTGARIDVPQKNARVAAETTVAGVSWAATGVSSVDVSTDDEATWQLARLEEPIGENSWRRWQLDASLPVGRTTISVRAWDANGELQATESISSHPGGATGIHRVVVERHDTTS